MRILTLIDVFSFAPMGGAGRVMFETSRRLAARGHEVTIVCRRREDLAEDQVVDGVRFRTYASRGSGRAALLRAAGEGPIEAVRGLLAEGRAFDIVHAHHPHPLLRVRRVDGIEALPVLTTFHSPWPMEVVLQNPWSRWLPGVPWRAWIERRALACADRVHVLSHSMQREVRRRYGKGPYLVIPGGVDTRRFVPPADREAARAALGWRPDEWWVLTIRRLVPRMGIRMLLDAVAILAPRCPDLRLAVGGTGPLRVPLERHAAERGISDRVRFLDYVAEEDLPRTYGAADLFATPSRALEGFGLATVESMACGTPAIGTPVGGTREILSTLEPRCLAKSVDAHSIMRAIEWWYPRRTYLAEMRGQVRRHVEEKYSWDSVALRMEDCLRRLAPGPRA